MPGARDCIRDLPGYSSPYVLKDVFREHAARMDKRWGNHMELIAEAVKKIDLLNKLFIEPRHLAARHRRRIAAKRPVEADLKGMSPVRLGF